MYIYIYIYVYIVDETALKTRTPERVQRKFLLFLFFLFPFWFHATIRGKSCVGIATKTVQTKPLFLRVKKRLDVMECEKLYSLFKEGHLKKARLVKSLLRFLPMILFCTREYSVGILIRFTQRVPSALSYLLILSVNERKKYKEFKYVSNMKKLSGMLWFLMRIACSCLR